MVPTLEKNIVIRRTSRTLFAFTFVTVLLGACAAGAQADVFHFNGPINVAQATTAQPGASGSGIHAFVLDTTARTLKYDIGYSGLAGTETAAHIHGPALPGATAGVVYALPAGSPKNGVINLVQVGAYTVAQQIADVKAGRWYVNVHSTNSPGGEIRGQITPAPIPTVSEWGMIIMTLLFLTVGTIVVGRRVRLRTAT